MPAPTLPSLPRYTPAPPTKEDCKSRRRSLVCIHVHAHARTVVEWAPLPIIDFSEAGTPEGRSALAPQVRDAMRTYGFLYIVNHGYTQAQVRLAIFRTIARGMCTDMYLSLECASL